MRLHKSIMKDIYKKNTQESEHNIYHMFKTLHMNILMYLKMKSTVHVHHAYELSYSLNKSMKYQKPHSFYFAVACIAKLCIFKILTQKHDE